MQKRPGILRVNFFEVSFRKASRRHVLHDKLRIRLVTPWPKVLVFRCPPIWDGRLTRQGIGICTIRLNQLHLATIDLPIAPIHCALGTNWCNVDVEEPAEVLHFVLRCRQSE